MKDILRILLGSMPDLRPDLIEKDLILHQVLKKASEDTDLRSTLLFKGGTCLIKAYLGYYRFSEDLDYTWRDQARWIGATKGQVTRQCSGLIDEIGTSLGVIASSLDLEFEPEKSNERYIKISSGGRMVTYFFRYSSVIDGTDAMLKIQINFHEHLQYPSVDRTMRNLIGALHIGDDLRFTYRKNLQAHETTFSFPCYDRREIFIEKCRAALTRAGFRSRDIIDIMMMEKWFGHTISTFRQEIIKKTLFATERYQRYRDRLSHDKDPLMSDEMMTDLLIPERPRGIDIEVEAERIHGELMVLRAEISDIESESPGHDHQ